VNKAVTNAILQSGVQVFSEWTVIDWKTLENDDAKLMIKSITIEKEEEKKKLTCDVLFNFYEKTIDLNAHLSKGREYIILLISNSFSITFKIAFNGYRKFNFSYRPVFIVGSYFNTVLNLK